MCSMPVHDRFGDQAPGRGAGADPDLAAALLSHSIANHLQPLRKRRMSRLLKARRTRYRTVGMAFIEGRPPRQSKPSEPTTDASMTA